MVLEMSRQIPKFATPFGENSPHSVIKKIESYPELANPQLQPRYSGIPTFFRLPHSERLDEADIGFVGVPFDGGVTNRPGARHGRATSATNRRSSARSIRRPAWRPSTFHQVVDLLQGRYE